MDKEWSVVYSHAQKELAAASEVSAQGFEVYLPVYKKVIRHARKAVERKVPLFPRYFFVNLDADKDMWRCINSTRGVVKLIMLNFERPTIVQHAVIDELKSFEDDEGMVSLAALDLFLPGQVVRILDGPFSGQRAVYKGISDMQRVEILLNFLNQDVRLQISVQSLEKAV